MFEMTSFKRTKTSIEMVHMRRINSDPLYDKCTYNTKSILLLFTNRVHWV